MDQNNDSVQIKFFNNMNIATIDLSVIKSLVVCPCKWILFQYIKLLISIFKVL